MLFYHRPSPTGLGIWISTFATREFRRVLSLYGRTQNAAAANLRLMSCKCAPNSLPPAHRFVCSASCSSCRCTHALIHVGHLSPRLVISQKFGPKESFAMECARVISQVYASLRPTLSLQRYYFCLGKFLLLSSLLYFNVVQSPLWSPSLGIFAITFIEKV